MADQRPPFPPFDEAAAIQKVLGAEAAWNTRDPDKVAAAYSLDSEWRNRDTFLRGRTAIRDFLAQKWARELDYALRKDLWAFRDNRIAVRFQYESLDASGQWWRSYGNENWEFDEHGLMRRREASINDVAITADERRIIALETKPTPAASRCNRIAALMTDFFDIAITPSVLALQEQKGSLGLYTDTAGPGPGALHTITEEVAAFFASRDSFYLASVGETGWPYVQHRGGEPGFVRILDHHTIGWAERNGNRQYVGTGNIAANGRVAAIFMDYPSRSRIKVYGTATHHADPSPELLESLGATDVRTDGAITVEILATAWNCPKYITPRFTEHQVSDAIGQLQERIAELEARLAE